MKVLVLIGGRKHSTSEAMAKLAMQGAYEAGADEVNAVRLLDLNFKNCTGCNACLMGLLSGKGNGDCILPGDDYGWLNEQIMDADSIIVVVPTFEKSAPGYYKSLMDRMAGPGHDVAMRTAASQKRKEIGLPSDGGPDPRSFKFRTAAFMGHGGSDWVHTVQPVMSHLAVSLNLTIVEQRIYPWDLKLFTQEEKIEEFRNVGRHVVEEYKKGLEKTEYYGLQGHCPVCHGEVFRLGEKANETACCLCGMTGTLSVDDNGKIKITFPEKEYAHSHMTMSGKFQHMDDLAGFMPYLATPEGQAAMKKMGEYTYLYPTVKPEHSEI